MFMVVLLGQKSYSPHTIEHTFSPFLFTPSCTRKRLSERHAQYRVPVLLLREINQPLPPQGKKCLRPLAPSSIPFPFPFPPAR
jgi:hypothetical protein